MTLLSSLFFASSYTINLLFADWRPLSWALVVWRVDWQRMSSSVNSLFCCCKNLTKLLLCSICVDPILSISGSISSSIVLAAEFRLKVNGLYSNLTIGLEGAIDVLFPI